MNKQPETLTEAKEQLDDAFKQAKNIHNESKDSANARHKEARKAAPDKQGGKAADEAHKQALSEAKKTYNDSTNKAQAEFQGYWRRKDAEAAEAAASAKEQSETAQKTLTEAKAQADAEHKRATSQGMDSRARKEADSARKEAHKQAKRVYDDSMKP